VSASPTASASPSGGPSSSPSPDATLEPAEAGLQTLRRALAEQAGVDPVEVNTEAIGPTWGARISQQALISLLIALAAIAAYITLRFEWAMAAGALLALVHDVVITAGFYALTAREVTPETVIAILTILGFSLYDTVVIYDKIQEHTGSPAMVARLGYDGVVNLSLNQTIMRSVNTSLVVLLPILSLLLFGGETLKDFAFAMFVGVAIGAYSSIFIAAPILTDFRRRRQARTTPATGRPKPVGAAAASATADDAKATAATAKVSAGPSRPAPKSKRRPPPKRKRR
jgi:preprotein translocase subunit SecF